MISSKSRFFFFPDKRALACADGAVLKWAYGIISSSCYRPHGGIGDISSVRSLYAARLWWYAFCVLTQLWLPNKNSAKLLNVVLQINLIGLVSSHITHVIS
jgi:hypothetical protein